MFESVTTLQITGWLVYLFSLFALYKRLPTGQFMTDKKVQHLVFGAAASVFGLWLFRAGIYQGLDVHFLWLSALPLVLGFRWAMVAALIALIGVTAVGKETWTMFGINGLLGVSLPIGLSYLIYSAAFHRLPPAFFRLCVRLCFFSGRHADRRQNGHAGRLLLP